MSTSKDTLARAYALEVLSALNEYTHINKEKLFATAVAYYRWFLAEEKAPASLEIYWHEFRAHHKTLVGGMTPEVRVACFITWFVEQHFHVLPPLTNAFADDKHLLALMERTRFSSPSFSLPTGDPDECYLTQWLYWHIDNPPKAGTLPDKSSLCRWADGMVGELMEQHELDDDECTVLFKHAEQFFAWSLGHLRTLDSFMDLFVAFLKSEAGQAIDQSDTPLADACFVNWFCQSSLLCPDEEAS